MLKADYITKSFGSVQVLKVTGAGGDHPFMAHVPESRYLKSVFCRVD